ncbi:Ig-like domain-containing protein [Acetobacterium wieringae]|uniref:Ig-like domain-containing protein n=1 Tax=Acetobacterium wieringae TaxID=52694 RepID=UPI0020343A08|nr:Ig-like domain-containing protein [Acetobacterium wieringae]URN83916.1 Ig-like domain-containing protein [Acetobacterium wieringae]
MKRKLKNSITILFCLILFSALFTTSALAENKTDTNSISSVENNIDVKTTSVNVEYTSDFKDGFKVNSLTAERSGDYIVFTVNYESLDDGGFAFFDSPSGATIMKIDNSGIKSGTNTSELDLTSDEFAKVLSVDTISMNFKCNGISSYISFKTEQLQSLSNTSFNGNVDFSSQYQEGFKASSLTAKRTGDNIAFTVSYESPKNGGLSLFDPPNGSTVSKMNESGIKVGSNSATLELSLADFKKALTCDNLTISFWSDNTSLGWINFKTAQLQSLLNADPDSEKISPTNIALNKTTSSIAVNGSEKLTATLSPSNVTETTITWSSSDPTIATVDSNGNVTGIKAGTATITATTVNSLSATCQITVTANTTEKSISYQTHVENVGWQDWKINGNMSGTSGQSLRLEGIKIKLNNYENLGVTYQTHIQNIGWEADTNRGWKSSGEMSGTQGLSYRLEAIQIKLTGSNSDNYDIYYHVHAQNVGWMGWAKNGESAGTAGYGYRLEGIEIKVVPKGDSAPSNNVTYANPFKENTNDKLINSIVGQWTDGKNHIYFQAVDKSSLSGKFQFKDIRDGVTGKYKILSVNDNVINILLYDQINGGITITNTNFSIDTGTQGDGIMNFWGKTWTYVSDSPIFSGQ